MINIISYSNDFRGHNKKVLIGDNEYIKLITDVMQNKDNIKTFNIRLNENEEITNYNNPVIEFGILESKYNYKKSTIENYDKLLFDYVRNVFRKEIF